MSSRLADTLIASSLELTAAERAGLRKLDFRRAMRAVASLSDEERATLLAAYAKPKLELVAAPEVALLPCDGCDGVSPADELTETDDGHQLCGHCLLEHRVRWTRSEARP